MSEPIVSDHIGERSFETTVHPPCLLLTFDDLLGSLPPYLEHRAGAGRAHLRIGKLASGTGLLSYAFSDSEGVIYLEGPSLSRLAEEAIGELEEQGSG